MNAPDGTSAGGELAPLIASKDWSATQVGDARAWPPELRTLLRLMLGTRYAMWMGWGPDLTFFYNDAYAAQTLGKKHPWALGRPAREVWAEIWETIRPRVEQVVRTGDATWDAGLCLLLERDGYPEETYHTFSYSPAPGAAEGEVAGLFCVVIEETERVISERRIALIGALAARLAQSTELDHVFDAVEACLATDRRDIPFALTYQFDEAGAPRRVSSAGFGEQDQEALRAADASASSSVWHFDELRDGAELEIVELDPAVRFPTGPWRDPPKQAVLLPIRWQAEERPFGVFVAGVNPHRKLDASLVDLLRVFVGQVTGAIAAVRTLEEERRRAVALAELDRAKTDFFSNVSHEFRTPLTLMLAPLEELRASLGPDTTEQKTVELVSRNAQRLLKLVNTLLDFSRIEAGRTEATFEATDLSAFTADLASTFRSVVESAGLRLVVDCPPLVEPVFIDRGMWERIVLNLLSNAFKFTLEGTITLRLRDEETSVTLEVEDTGTGIPESQLAHVFERFHRIPQARARSHEGSGIGLALVHELVRMHGGTTRVESIEGTGTTFSVELPRGDAHLPKDRRRAPTNAPEAAGRAEAYVAEARSWAGVDPAAESARQRGSEEPRQRIVFADDNADMREYVARLLREHWDVETVGDGLAALRAIRRDPPNLVVSDVMMPELDGYGLLRALRNDAALRGVPVVLLSARAGEEAAGEALRAGADDYIVKPFTARNLLVRVAARLAAATASHELGAQRRNLYRHFMQAPFALAILRGPEHVVELANDAALRSWNRNADVTGLPLVEAFPEIRDQAFLHLIREVYRSGSPYHAREASVMLPLGPERALVEEHYNLLFTPLTAPNGTVEGVLAFGFDVTAQVADRKAADVAHREADRLASRLALALEEKERALRQAEAANRSKDEFLATMSHELRTPLHAMLGWATLLNEDTMDEAKVRRGLGIIERNARAQERIVNDLLDVSRIISGKLRLNMLPTIVADVVRAATEVVRPAADAKGVALEVSLDPDLGSVIGDPDRLQQVVWNLLANAVRFTPTGEWVRVLAERSNGSVVLRVQDNGQGIATEHLPSVFDRFRQVDSSTTRVHGGLGLGLAIVRHLVEAHGGTVSASSEGLGFGTTFTVRLPIRAVDTTSLQRAGTDAAGFFEDDARQPDAPRLDGLRALVVDDDDDARELVREILEGVGAEVVAAPSASSALEAKGPFGVVISDIGMPGVDGYGFIRQLRSRSTERDTPAVALTAYARSDDRRRALASGFQEHLTKPVDARKLIETVRSLSTGANAEMPRSV